jgi:hypothetical protein
MSRLVFTCLFLSLLLIPIGVHAEIVYNKPGERPPPKFGCAPGTEVYGNPDKREGRVMCVAPTKNDRYVKHGMYMNFDEHKELRRKGLYYQDKRHGRWTEFDRFGRKKQQDDYEYGKLMKRTLFDEEGTPKVKFDAKSPKQSKADQSKKKQGRILYGTDGRPL